MTLIQKITLPILLSSNLLLANQTCSDRVTQAHLDAINSTVKIFEIDSKRKILSKNIKGYTVELDITKTSANEILDIMAYSMKLQYSPEIYNNSILIFDTKKREIEAIKAKNEISSIFKKHLNKNLKIKIKRTNQKMRVTPFISLFTNEEEYKKNMDNLIKSLRAENDSLTQEYEDEISTLKSKVRNLQQQNLNISKKGKFAVINIHETVYSSSKPSSINHQVKKIVNKYTLSKDFNVVNRIVSTSYIEKRNISPEKIKPKLTQPQAKKHLEVVKKTVKKSLEKSFNLQNANFKKISQLIYSNGLLQNNTLILGNQVFKEGDSLNKKYKISFISSKKGVVIINDSLTAKLKK